MSQTNKNSLLIALIAGLVYLPFLGGVHLFDWDEINFAEIAREMVVLDDYLRIHVNFIPFTEKPPLFFWMQALSMEVFGVGEYAARFPNAICGIVALVYLYRLGEKLIDTRFGWLWAGAYFGSILPTMYFKSGIMDPWFNLFIFLGIMHLIAFYWRKDGIDGNSFEKKKWKYLVLAGVFTGLGIMLKGPVAYLITALTLGVYWILLRFRFYINVKEVLIYTLIALAVTGIWYGVETLVHGPQFAIEFTIRQWTIFSTPDAGHAGFPGYHFVILFVGCFPASVFLIRAHGNLNLKTRNIIDLKKWMIILFWVVLILFTIVKSKIVHYSSMAYYPITFLAALTIYQMWDRKIAWKRWMGTTMVVFVLLFGLVIIAFPWLGRNTELIKPLFSKDPFALANLDANINWTGLESIAGVLFIAVVFVFLALIKKGKWKRATITLFGGVGLFVFLTIILFIKKIEGYSQNAAIEFYKSKQECNCYVTPERFKSYGHLFYAEPMPGLNENRLNQKWLMTGNVDRDVYFVAKIHKTDQLEELDDVEFLYEKNGFTFWKREAVSQP